MANEPDKRSDFLTTESEAGYQMPTEEVDTLESPSRSVLGPDRDKASAATDDHGTFLLRDSFASRGQAK